MGDSMQEAPKKTANPLLKFWQWARDNKRVWIPSALFLLDASGRFQVINGIMTWMLGSDWPARVFYSPWFVFATAMMIVITVFFLGRAGLRQDRKLAELAEAHEAVALKPISTLIRNSADMIKLGHASRSVDRIFGEIGAHQDEVGDAATGKSSADHLLQRSHDKLNRDIAELERQFEIKPVTLAFPAPKFEADGRTIDPEKNEEYYAAHYSTCESYRRRCAVIRSQIARRLESLADSNEQVLRS